MLLTTVRESSHTEIKEHTNPPLKNILNENTNNIEPFERNMDFYNFNRNQVSQTDFFGTNFLNWMENEIIKYKAHGDSFKISCRYCTTPLQSKSQLTRHFRNNHHFLYWKTRTADLKFMFKKLGFSNTQ
jgi:hypothetical protein